MTDVQLILMYKDDNTFLYGELINDIIYCGKDRQIYKDDLKFSTDVPDAWSQYAIGRTFRIVTEMTDSITFHVQFIETVAITKAGYVMPLFSGELRKKDDSFKWATLYTTFPRLLMRPVKAVKQPPIVGSAPRAPSPPKTLEDVRREHREYEASRTPAERAADKAFVDDWERACGIQAVQKKKVGWFN